MSKGTLTFSGVQTLFCHNSKREREIETQGRDVLTGATGATAVAPKFSDTLALSKPRGAESAHHRRGRR